MPNTVQVHYCRELHRSFTVRVETPTYTTGVAQAFIQNIVQVQVQCALPRPRTYVQSVCRSGCPCQTLYMYRVQCAHPTTRAYVKWAHRSGRPRQTMHTCTYSLDAQAHERTYYGRIAWATHAVCAPTFTHPRTTEAPFRLFTSTTVQVQV